MKLPITVAYVTVEDPADRRTWSGTNYFLLQALQERVHRVVTLGPLRPQPELFLCRAINQVLLRTTGKRFNYRDSYVISRAYARLIGPRLAGVDLIIAPAGLAAIALLRTPVPIVHINDRCIAGALEYHRILSGLADFSRQEGLALERQALKNAAMTIYASEWATEAAHKVMPELVDRIRTIPFGANLEGMPPFTERSSPGDPWTLLFLGVDWEDKGGPIAYEALLELKRRGHRGRLVVAGCDPPSGCDDPDLVRMGFLDKNDPDQRARLEHALATADILVLPTRFEAYGIVCCEAAAYGLPVVATHTGGLPTIVREGVTGILLGPDLSGTDYATAIERVLGDPSKWSSMRTAARARYEQVLNWRAFVDGLMSDVQARGLISNAR